MTKNKMPVHQLLARVILIAILVWLAVIALLIAVIDRTGRIDQPREADAIVVLGAGLARDGRPGYALVRRSAHASELWHQGYADTIVCTGGIAPTQARSEADGCRDVLLRRGVPDSAILLEERSTSTEENALYARDILQLNALQSVIVVSDSYHVFRASYIFETVGYPDVSLSPVPAERIRGYPTYNASVVREVLALHWQVFKTALNLPITSL
ncbi:MAG: YdcF family protein [Anaerolineae bacterium]